MADSTPNPATTLRGSRWLRVVTLLLVAEKVIQHTAVTVAFVLDFGRIRGSVALDYRLFMVTGAASAILFALSGWALARRKAWARWLIVALALADIAGEFVAQGTLMIVINVSFVVALALLVLAPLLRREAR